MSFVKNAAAGAVLGGSLLFTAGLGIANAQPVEAPDGLVNLAVGDVTILESVSADTAATAAGAICGSVPAEVGALAAQVDGQGADQIVCSGLPGGDLVLTQNAISAQEQGTEGSSDDAPVGPAEGTEGTDSTEGADSATTPGESEVTAPADGA